MRFLYLQQLALTAIAASVKELVSPKQSFEPTTLDGVADQYWSFWWARNAENDYTFYEEWKLQLKNGSTWGDKALA